MAYYTVKRDMAPITLGVRRYNKTSPKYKVTRAFIDDESRIEGWATNTTLKEMNMLLSLQVFELSSGKEVFSNEKSCKLLPNTTVELFDMSLPGIKSDSKKKDNPLIVSARLLNPSHKSEVIARCTNWPQPYRYLNIPQPSVDIRIENDQVFVKTNDVPVKGLWLYVEDVDNVTFDDNCIDLIPGDEQIINIKGFEKNKELLSRYYGMLKDSKNTHAIRKAIGRSFI